MNINKDCSYLIIASILTYAFSVLAAPSSLKPPLSRTQLLSKVQLTRPSPNPPMSPKSISSPTPTPIASPKPSATPIAEKSNPTVCAAGFTLAGLDVSKYQPNVNWDTVRSSGRDFVFVKATEGLTITDENYETNIKELVTANMTHGSYHYFTASSDPIQQADFFLAASGKIPASELPAMFDWEASDNVAPEIVIEKARIWLDRVETVTGKIPIIYTYPKYWASLGTNPENVKSLTQFARYPLFIADYSGKCPQVPAPWTNWMFWQTEVSQEPGVIGKVDEDVFNGNPLDLVNILSGAHLF